MNIQINTDSHIDGHEAFAAEVEAKVRKSLSHIRARVQWVEIHLTDPGGGSDGDKSKRCMMEACLEGENSTAVSCEAATIAQAVAGAADKLKRSLESTVEHRLEHR